MTDGPEWFAPKRYGYRRRTADQLAGLGDHAGLLRQSSSPWRLKWPDQPVGMVAALSPITVDLHGDRGIDNARRLALALGRG